MAVKFTLPDGSTTDVSTQTARLFVSSTPEGFVDLLKAMRPGLTTPVRMARYLVTHPRLFGALPVLRDANKVPASYATVEYHGLHAFRWIGGDGSARFVRYHLVPAAGEEYLPDRPPTARARTFSLTSWVLALRLGRRGLTFGFRSPGRRIRRSIRRRPGRAPNVTVGTIEITGLDTQREHGDDIVVFDPMRVTDGIEPSDDPVLRFRTLAYSLSVKLRTGVDRGPEAPPV